MFSLMSLWVDYGVCSVEICKVHLTVASFFPLMVPCMFLICVT